MFKKKSKARLQMCTCGKHGRLLGDDGYFSAEFASKHEAEYNLEQAQIFRTIHSSLVEGIRGQIAASTLPDTASAVDKKLATQLHQYNVRRAAMTNGRPNDGFDPERIHDTHNN